MSKALPRLLTTKQHGDLKKAKNIAAMKAFEQQLKQMQADNQFSLEDYNKQINKYKLNKE